MVKSVDKLGSAKRFGPRYGTKPKYQFAKIEKEQRKLHKCPYCNQVKVKRVAVGIWHCRKCDSKFTGKAYTIAKTSLTKEELETKQAERLKEEIIEEQEEPAKEVIENG